MIIIVCSVLDVAAGAYQRPIFVASTGVAVRMFQDEVNREAGDNVMFHHPEHFQLFEIASYDDALGSFCSVVPAPRLLAMGADVHASHVPLAKRP